MRLEECPVSSQARREGERLGGVSCVRVSAVAGVVSQ